MKMIGHDHFICHSYCHFSVLSRIKARNRKTEILWIFFGIHTANAILMIEKIRNKTAKAA